MDYKARYYSPYLNRFVSPDTIVPDPADPQSFNRYSYVRNNPIARRDPSGHCDNWICDLVTAPIQLVTDIANGVSNIGNPEYQLGPQSQEIALDIIKRAATAPITGDFPDSSDYVVPADEVAQNHRGIANTAEWAINAADAAVDTSVVVAGGVQAGVSLLRTTSTPLLFQEGFSAGEKSMVENIANKYGQHGLNLTGVKVWRADGGAGIVASWSDDGITLYEGAFGSEETLAKGLYEESLHRVQGITEFGGGNVEAAEKAVKPAVDEWWKWATGGN